MIAAAQVRADRTRRAALAARARGHVARPMSPQAPPTAVENAYVGRLHRLVSGAITRAYAPLLRVLPDLVAQAKQERGDAVDWRADATHSGHSASAAIKDAARQAQGELGGSAARSAAADAASDAHAHVQGQLGKQMREVLGIDLAPDPRAKARMAAFVHENVKLIGGIGPALAAEIERIVLAGLTGGQLHEMMALAIKRKMNIAIGRAELIAIDQVGKIVGQVNAARQQDLGITHFFWRTSKDERVRGNPAGLYPKATPSHYDRDGKRYAYTDQPKGKSGEPELPGVPIRCRCGAEADTSTVLGEGPAAPAPRDPTQPDAPNHAPTVEEAEAEAERLRREVEAMLASQMLGATPDLPSAAARRLPPPDAPIQVDAVPAPRLAGLSPVPPQRHREVLEQGRVGKYARGAQGATGSYDAMIGDGAGSGMRAKLKPRDEEHLLLGLPAGVQYLREAAAAAVARDLNVGDMMPETIVRDLGPPFGPASLQAFHEGALHTHRLTADQESRIDLHAVARMRAFDLAIGNADRHGNNVMWRDDGRVVRPALIDHGLALPPDKPVGFRIPGTRTINLANAPLRTSDRDAILQVDKAAIVRTLAKNNIDEASIRGTVYRLAVMQARPEQLDKQPTETVDAAKARWMTLIQMPEAQLTLAERIDLDALVDAALAAARSTP